MFAWNRITYIYYRDILFTVSRRDKVRSKYNTYIIQYMSTVYNCCLLEEVKRELQSVWCGTRSFCFYESIKREVQRRPIYECRYDERLKNKDEGSTRLTYTGLVGGLEHLKIKTRLIDERFVSVMGECVI